MATLVIEGTHTDGDGHTCPMTVTVQLDGNRIHVSAIRHLLSVMDDDATVTWIEAPTTITAVEVL